MWFDSDVLTGMLQRVRDHWLSEKEPKRRLFLLPRLVAVLQREPRLSALLDDIEREVVEEEERLTAEDVALRDTLRELWQQYEGEIRQRLEAVYDDEQLHGYGHMDNYAKNLERSEPTSFPTSIPKGDPSTSTQQRIMALSHWTQWILNQSRDDDEDAVPEAISTVHGQVEHLKRVHEAWRRRFEIGRQTLPGVALRRIRAVCSDLAPEVPAQGSGIVAEVEYRQQDEFARKVWGEGELNDATPSVRSIHEVTTADVRLLCDDLLLRVAEGQSRQGAVRRYAARCEAYDADRLRRLCEDDTANAERTLTVDFAGYLFDLGFSPIIEPTMANLRPDVVAAFGSNLFYVEAKQYSTSPRAMLLKAYKQVWVTWGRLRNSYDIPEAYLLVFRRRGPRVELPQTVRHDGLSLHSVLVDIAEHSGSKETDLPTVISAMDVLPSEDQE